MEILLAVVIPPAAIWLCRDSLGRSFARSIVLGTLLWACGILPGVLYAVWIVAHHSPAQHAKGQPQLGRPNPFGSSYDRPPSQQVSQIR